MKLALLLFAATSIAHAETRLMARWEEGEAIHIANENGAINRHGDIAIEVHLVAPDRLEVTAIGTRTEHNLFETFSTDDETTWKTTWTGRWSEKPGALHLELIAVGDTCKHTKTGTVEAPKALPCKAVSKRAELACTTERVTLEDFTGSAKPVAVDAWQCGVTTGELGESPTSWLLGKSGCIKSVGGMGSAHYTRC
jgi:hypothetical protein